MIHWIDLNLIWKYHHQKHVKQEGGVQMDFHGMIFMEKWFLISFVCIKLVSLICYWIECVFWEIKSTERWSDMGSNAMLWNRTWFMITWNGMGTIGLITEWMITGKWESTLLQDWNWMSVKWDERHRGTCKSTHTDTDIHVIEEKMEWNLMSWKRDKLKHRKIKSRAKATERKEHNL